MLDHPDMPFSLEVKGHKIIRHYPSGATEPGTTEDWYVAQLLVRLDKLIADRASVDLTLDGALKATEAVVSELEKPSSKTKPSKSRTAS